MVPGRQRQTGGGARSAGTPFRSFYTPEEMLSLAREAGFKEARHVSGASLAERYFTGRPDGLRLSTGRTCWWPPRAPTARRPRLSPPSAAPARRYDDGNGELGGVPEWKR